MSNLSEEDKKILENQNNGMGIFGFLIVLVISVTAIILLLDTFKHQLISFFPNLDNFLGYIFEVLIPK